MQLDVAAPCAAAYHHHAPRHPVDQWASAITVPMPDLDHWVKRRHPRLHSPHASTPCPACIAATAALAAYACARPATTCHRPYGVHHPCL
ncbi:hypothetical protein E2562_014677 [Oryza meyeriana var. granulata]|uniref:Uncharacterized protein n=1 Tax=Oryza meyeriana var. granulata TaxID=110450 RepID=A0A6G1D3V0_9ORYZ|nr:hypothetical protein E2562_014677 [Oryza meyeriana var. granulata]